VQPCVADGTAPVRHAERAVAVPRARPTPWSELLLLLVLYVGYSLSRFLVDGGPAEALANGRYVLALEQSLGLDVEADIVRWLVASPALSLVAGYTYATLHYTVTPAVLLWLYRVHPRQYRSARSILVLSTCAALVCFWWLPTAPPRLLSPDYPDVLALTSHWGWWGADASAPRGLGSLTNEYAALPSMHVGWAVWCGAVVALLARRPLVRVAAVAYPLLVTGVVVATANHYLLDAAAGAALVLAIGAMLWCWRRFRRPSFPSLPRQRQDPAA
jgi:energy-converting hydrogenase Eha subunit C